MPDGYEVLHTKSQDARARAAGTRAKVCLAQYSTLDKKAAKKAAKQAAKELKAFVEEQEALEAEAREQFRIYDSDQSGNIDIAELANVTKGMGIFDDIDDPEDPENDNNKNAIIENGMRDFDDDRDGKLDFKEFCMLYNKFVTERDLLEFEAPSKYKPPPYLEGRDPNQVKALQELLKTSIFAVRRKGESKDFFDNAKIRTKAFKLDWKRMTKSPSWINLLEVFDLGEFDKNDKKFKPKKKEVKQIKKMMLREWTLLNDIFTFYTCKALEGAVASMDLDEWMKFTHAAGFRQGKFNRKKPEWGIMDLKACFDEVNVEAEATKKKAKKENEVNPDDQMMRFEFMEGVLRMMLRFEVEDANPKIAVRIDGFLRFLRKNLERECPASMLDRNVYRIDRLYHQSALEVLFAFQRELRAMYALMVGPDFMPATLQEWMWLCTRLDIIDDRKGRRITDRELHMMFMWSQMLNKDEIKGRDKAYTLSFDEFLEVVCRMGDTKDLPTAEDLKKHGFGNTVEAIEDAIARQEAEPRPLDPLIPRRPSSDFWALHTTHTQTSGERLKSMLDYMFAMISPGCGSVLLGTFKSEVFQKDMSDEFSEIFRGAKFPLEQVNKTTEDELKELAAKEAEELKKAGAKAEPIGPSGHVNVHHK